MNNSQNYIQKLIIVLSVVILSVTIFSPSALAASSSTCPSNMVFISGGEFKMGSEQPEFIEELPVEDVSVSVHFALTPTKLPTPNLPNLLKIQVTLP